MKQFEVAGIPVIGATLAACAVFVTQWMWWGALFNDSWPQLNGLTEADLEVPYSWWVGGLAVIAAQVIGIAVILRNRDWPNIADAITHIGGLSLLLAVPMAGYRLVYLPEHSWELFVIDGASFVIGWLLSAAIVTALKSRAVAAPMLQGAGSNR